METNWQKKEKVEIQKGTNNNGNWNNDQCIRKLYYDNLKIIRMDKFRQNLSEPQT